MDDPASSDFAAAIDGPDSKLPNSGSGDAATVERVAGRIDPALAIGAEGIVGGTSGSPDRGPGSGKRGRHPGNCACERCAAKGREQVAYAPKEEKSRNIRASFVEKTLQGIHLGLVAITKCPEFNLDNDDAKKLGEATAQVLSYYKVKMTAKQEAYALLFEAAAQVYPPMIVSIYLRKKMEAETRKPATTAPNFSDAKRAQKPAATIHPIKGGFDPAHIIVPDGV